MLDKTGTITEGRPAVTKLVLSSEFSVLSYLNEQHGGIHQEEKTLHASNLDKQNTLELKTQNSKLLWLAASAERVSEHPLGEAIVRAAQEQGLELSKPESFEAIPGQGLSALVDGHAVLVGNTSLMQSWSIDISALQAPVSYTHLGTASL